MKNAIKILLAIGLILLVTIPFVCSADDHTYRIQVPGTDAKIKFTSVYNLDQKGNTFYTKEGDAAIVFEFGVEKGALHKWVYEVDLRGGSGKHLPTRSTFGYDVGRGRFSYAKGVVVSGSYTNAYGDIVNAYDAAGMTEGTFYYNGKNITFTMEVIGLDGIGKTLQELWIDVPSKAEKKEVEVQEPISRVDVKSQDPKLANKTKTKLNPDPAYWTKKIADTFLDMDWINESERMAFEEDVSENYYRLLDNNITEYDVHYLEALASQALSIIVAYEDNKTMDSTKKAALIKDTNEILKWIVYDENNQKIYNNLFKLDPHISRTKAEILTRLGDNNGSLECYNKLIESDPKVTGAWSDKASLLDAMGRYDEAIHAYNMEIDNLGDSISDPSEYSLVKARIAFTEEKLAIAKEHEMNSQ